MENPKPCKCGRGGEAQMMFNQPTPSFPYYVRCKKCDTRSNLFTTETEAIEAWNTAMSGNKTGKRISRLMAEYLAQDCFN